MFRRALPLFSAVLALSLPGSVLAAAPVEAWTPANGILRANAAGITLPQQLAGLSLSKSGEVSNGGKSVDNYAQYLSDDGAIQATLYVYLPSYADASLAAYMTDKAIMERFGPRTRRTAYAATALAGKRDHAIRAVYDDAADGKLTTAAAFAHAGRWLIKLRVTGPTERRKQVLAGLDGMLDSLRFDQPQNIRPTAPAAFAACAKQDAPTEHPADRTDSALPEEGRVPLCVRDRVQTADGSYDILQRPGNEGGAIIVPIDDAGTMITFDRIGSSQGYQLTIHSIAQTEAFGIYDDIPASAQIAQIIDGKDPQTARARTTLNYAANGEVTVRRASTEMH